MGRQITAIFEQWYIGDGTYPPFRKHQLVNVAFEMHPELLHGAEGNVTHLRHIGNAQYQFTGVVLRYYDDKEMPILLIEADGFRFYISSSVITSNSIEQGRCVSGQGTLTLDHYLWAKFGHEYDSVPPDLFYTLRVARIREVAIPESHIARGDKGWSAPTWIPADEVQNSRDVESMDQRQWEAGFFLVDYDDQGVGGKAIPRTAS